MDGSTLATIIIALFVGLFAIIIIIKGFRIVQQSQVMIIERLGKYNRTLQSGINIIIPLIDKPRSIKWRYVEEDVWAKRRRYDTTSGEQVGSGGRGLITTIKDTNVIDLRETVCDFPGQSVITKDNVN